MLQVLREAGKPLDVGELAKQLSPLTDGTYRDRVRGARRQSVRPAFPRGRSGWRIIEARSALASHWTNW
ncbi:hypothetical protein Isolate57596_53030 (plasmid) [Mycobacteroides abscessus subsp. abscessus]